MKFKLNIEIDMDDAAFEDNPDELKNILQAYVNYNYFPHADWVTLLPLKDINGNRVGTATAEVIDE